MADPQDGKLKIRIGDRAVSDLGSESLVIGWTFNNSTTGLAFRDLKFDFQLPFRAFHVSINLQC
jgi:hypothetical protein